jgi:hypothetical protein
VVVLVCACYLSSVRSACRVVVCYRMWDRSQVRPAWSVICIRTCTRDIQQQQQQQQLVLNYPGGAPRLLIMQRCGLVSSCGPVSALKQVTVLHRFVHEQVAWSSLKQVAWSSLDNTQAHTQAHTQSTHCHRGHCSVLWGRARADFEVVLALATQVVAHGSVYRRVRCTGA